MRIAVLALVVACSSREPQPRVEATHEPAIADAAVVDAASHALDDIVTASDAFVRDGCADTVQGKPFRGARILCLAMASMALASVALDDPRRAEDIVRRLDALVMHALGTAARAPFVGTGTVRVATGVDTRELPGSVLYRGLLGLVAIAHHRFAGSASRWTVLVDALAASLARDLEPGFVRSYRDGIWPCDHAPAAAFLRLHARLRDDETSRRAADVVIARLRGLLDASGGFPTRVDAGGRIVDVVERGTTLAFTASFLLAAEPELARAFAERLVARCDRAPFAACREWTDGSEHAPDAASGPIVGGYSVGATALAVVATRALQSLDWSRALLQTASLAGPRSGAATLEAALLAWGATARAW